MIRRFEQVLLGGFQRVEAALNRALGEECNPLYQLGALAFLCFWIATITGIYLYVFFDTSVTGAYASVQRLTEQWWLGGVMRSLHRYSSAAMAVVVTVHLLRELALGRFRGARSFSWISGVPLLWLLFASAIGGYVLVWDELAQYAATATAEWLDWLPVFGDPLARNFLDPSSMSDRLFSLLVFLHIAVPLFLLGGMFIHIKRIKLARINPYRRLTVAFCAALVAASLVYPATSMAPADLTRAPTLVNIDWIYMNVYPLLDAAGPRSLWALLVGLSTFLVVMPRLSPQKGSVRHPAEPPAAAAVDPANCNGCSWCFQDCPFEAIIMIPHETKPGMRQAEVNPDLCTACGICVGACPSATPFRNVEELVSGIEIPDYPLERLRENTKAALARFGDGEGILVFGCDHAAPVDGLSTPGTAAISLPCIALLPPSFIDWAARQDEVAEVLITGCHPEDCYHRKGSRWVEERLAGERQPHLRTASGKAKVTVQWAGPREVPVLEQTLTVLHAGGRPRQDNGSPWHLQEPQV